MANIIKVKGKTTAGAPSLAQMVDREIIYNIAEDIFYIRHSGAVVAMAGHGIYAKLASPTFTGTPIAPTAAPGTNNTQIATTAFVLAALAGAGTGDMLKSIYDTTNNGKVDLAEDSEKLGGNLASLYALLASPAFTGTPLAPTAAGGTNTTQIATTAFVKGAIDALIASSPGALDTLNELAAALGNDANFATTVTNALALKLDANSTIDGGTIA